MLVGALCALLFLVAGGLAYAGRGRSIVLKGFPTPVLFFGLAWLGAGGLIVPSRASCRRPVTLSSGLCWRSRAWSRSSCSCSASPGCRAGCSRGGTESGATGVATTRSTRPSGRGCKDAGALVDGGSPPGGPRRGSARGRPTRCCARSWRQPWSLWACGRLRPSTAPSSSMPVTAAVSRGPAHQSRAWSRSRPWRRTTCGCACWRWWRRRAQAADQGWSACD
jgi:hypothetical protein